MYPLVGRDLGYIIGYLDGFTIGLVGGIFISYFEYYYDNPFNKQYAFINRVILKVLAYYVFFLILIPTSYAFWHSIEDDTGFITYLTGEKMRIFIFQEDFYLILIYTLFFTSLVVFTIQLSRKLGQNVLWNFITGKYRFPKEEERIFMFLDLNNSTVIAEKLGDIRFNTLLNEIFYDLTSSILSTYGDIYRYVGDEVVVTWKMKHGLKHSNCIRTFFQAKYTIHLLREKYMTKYGFVPTFSAGFHCGKVIVGEIGDVKSQITFLGDVMYTAAAIEKKCRHFEKENLVSETLIKRISIPDIYEMKLAGSLENNERKPMDLYTISEIEMANT